MEQVLLDALAIDIGEIMDPRPGPSGMRDHLLFDIVVIGLCTLIVGGEGFEAMNEFGESKQEWLHQFLELPSGIPSASTFRRIFAAIDPSELNSLLLNFSKRLSVQIEQKEESSERTLPVDGKSCRGSRDKSSGTSALHLVSVFDAASEVCLGQVAVDDKSNEITAIPALLELIDIEGSVVTIDAMGCQKSISQLIVEKSAGYVFALKKNHGDLYSSVSKLFQDIKCLHDLDPDIGTFTTVNDGHGRIETRTYLAVPAQKVYGLSGEWAGLASFVAVDATRETSTKTTTERRFYISSEQPDSEVLGRHIRNHWAIENKLHWFLDVVMREDASRIRSGNATQNIAILRKMAQNLIKSLKIKRLSGKRKMLRAALRIEFLEQILLQSNVLPL